MSDAYNDWNDPELPDALVSAREVAQTPEQGPKGAKGYILIYREMYERDPKSFVAELRALEKNWQDYKLNRLSQFSGTSKVDLGTDKAIALCEQLLKDTLAKIDKTCPTCGREI